jgi:D-alanyl-lipoteichoic acid acyltransferase DltB (MBOAT superfamily)
MAYINSLIGLRKYEFVYTPLKRYKKKIVKQSLFSLMVQIIDIGISNSFRPIRLLSLIGLSVSLAYLFYVGFMVFLVVVFGMKHLVPQGWISTSTVFSVLFFVLFSLLALISEYLIRSITETRDEPFYFISDDIDKSVILGKERKNLDK